LEKNDKKKKIVRVTITPSSPPEQRNRAAERCYIAARARKRAGTKMQSPARRQNVPSIRVFISRKCPHNEDNNAKK